MASLSRSIALPQKPVAALLPEMFVRTSYHALEVWWAQIHNGPTPLAAGGYRGGWWPARSPLEIMVTAILVQNTRWENVTRAVGLLEEAGLLPQTDSPAAQAAAIRALHALGPGGLEPLLRPAGCASVKSRRLHHLLAFLCEAADADLSRLAKMPTALLRSRLLELHGIGPETADAILLYAQERPVFPVDAYLRRIFERHGWSVAKDSYETLRAKVEAAFGGDIEALHRYHALIVELAKRHCGKVADCANCPLKPMLPG